MHTRIILCVASCRSQLLMRNSTDTHTLTGLLLLRILCCHAVWATWLLPSTLWPSQKQKRRNEAMDMWEIWRVARKINIRANSGFLLGTNRLLIIFFFFGINFPQRPPHRPSLNNSSFFSPFFLYELVDLFVAVVCAVKMFNLQLWWCNNKWRSFQWLAELALRFTSFHARLFIRDESLLMGSTHPSRSQLPASDGSVSWRR